MSFPVNLKKQFKDFKEKALAWSPFSPTPALGPTQGPGPPGAPDRTADNDATNHHPTHHTWAGLGTKKKEKDPKSSPFLSKSSPAIAALNAQLKKWREKLARQIDKLPGHLGLGSPDLEARTASAPVDPLADTTDTSLHSMSESEIGEERFVSGISNTDDESSSSASALRRPPYQKLTPDRMLKAQDHDIKQVAELLEVSRAFARTLLMHFNWDPARLLEVFFDKGKDQVYRSAGLRAEKVTEAQGHSAKAHTFLCSVCTEESDAEDTTSLACGHRFCNECWQQYLSVQVREGNAKKVHCMGKTKDGRACALQFDDSKLLAFLDDDLYKKYASKMLESYVEDNKRVRWCPSVPHCGNAVMLAPSQPRNIEVRCACEWEFCFHCGREPHAPASCRMVAKWALKLKDDSANAEWLAEHVKDCPKCGSPVHKSGGCHHVVCHCGQSFCWLCGQATGNAHSFEKIDGHSCGRYKKHSTAEKSAPTATAAEAEPPTAGAPPGEVTTSPSTVVETGGLRRFTFFFRRFKAHEAARKLDDKALRRLRRKVLALMTAEMSLYYIKWVQHAVEKLLQCRRILAYSYVFCYFVFGDREFSGDLPSKTLSIAKTLFEDIQQQFELDLERLAALLEIPAKAMDETMCQALISQTVIVDRRCRAMFDVIHSHILSETTNITIVNYIATTRGKSTLLVEPRFDFAAEFRGADGPGRSPPHFGTPRRANSTSSARASTNKTSATKRNKRSFSHMARAQSVHIRGPNAGPGRGRHMLAVDSNGASAAAAARPEGEEDDGTSTGPDTPRPGDDSESSSRPTGGLGASRSSFTGLLTSESSLDETVTATQKAQAVAKQRKRSLTFHSEPGSEEGSPTAGSGSDSELDSELSIPASPSAVGPKDKVESPTKHSAGD